MNVKSREQQSPQQLAQVAAKYQAGKVITIVMMETIMKDVNGMEGTVAVIMLTQIIVHLVNALSQMLILLLLQLEQHLHMDVNYLTM